MNPIMYFDIAGILIICLILYTLYTRYQIRIAENEAFKVLIWATLLSVVLDLLAAEFYQNDTKQRIQIAYIVNWFYFVFRNSLMILYGYYLLVLTNTIKTMRKSVKIIAKVVIGIDSGILLSDLFLHWVFYFDAQGNYRRGPAMLVLYTTTAICIIFSVYYIHKYGKTMDKNRKLAFYMFPLLPVITSAIQFFYPHILVEGFGVSLSLLWIVLNIARPEQGLEGSTGSLNKDTFIADIVSLKGNFKLVGVSICEFELYRENYGFQLMQKYLREVSNYLNDFMRHNRVYYIGKGQFILLIHESSEEKANAAIREINRRFGEEWVLDDLSIIIKTAIILLRFPQEVESINEILDYMICLKESASSQDTHIYTVDNLDISQMQRIVEVERAIDRALENQSLQVYYQPIYNTKEKKISAAEALVRLFDEKLGEVSPEEFIPIAEKSGKIIKIGSFVVQSVCNFIRQEDIAKRGLHYIEVNLSVVECMQSEMAKQLLKVMEEYKVGVEQINFEITETAAAANLEMLSINMHLLHQQGIKFSLDDYGTGYSNIHYMMDLPFHVIKIDKSILWSSFENKKAMIAMKSSINMIQEMKMQIVAEGVETKEMAEQMIELGCDFLQGYYFSKPVPPEEFISVIQNIFIFDTAKSSNKEQII